MANFFIWSFWKSRDFTRVFWKLFDKFFRKNIFYLFFNVIGRSLVIFVIKCKFKSIFNIGKMFNLYTGRFWIGYSGKLFYELFSKFVLLFIIVLVLSSCLIKLMSNCSTPNPYPSPIRQVGVSIIIVKISTLSLSLSLFSTLSNR